MQPNIATQAEKSVSVFYWHLGPAPRALFLYSICGHALTNTYITASTVENCYLYSNGYSMDTLNYSLTSVMTCMSRLAFLTSNVHHQ